MRRRYITFISLLVVAMFSIMPLSQLSSPPIAIDSNPTGKINPSVSNGLLGEVVNTWHVSGKTCAPSSASIESAITLKIDVTSFSESSGAGDTPLYFIVSGTTVHTDYIGGTGVYTYTWDVNSMPGNINFHAEYLSGSEFYSMHSMAPKPSVFFRNSYSTFGNSNIHVEKYMDEMGYDGNNTIYLSNVNSPIVPSFNLSESYANETKCYDENGFKASMDNSIGLGAYISQGFNTEKHRECIGVTMFGGASGYGGNMESEVCDRHHPIEITRYTLAPYYTSLSLEGINSPESNVMHYEPNNSTGINTTTTHSSSKPGFNMLKYKQDILEGIVDNTVNFMGIQTSLSSIGKYYSDASLDSYSICKSGNGPVYIHFHVNPSSGKSMGSNKCRYTYGTIVTYDISIRNYNNSESFKLGFNNVYGCTKSSYGGGSTSTTNAAHTSLCANAVPSSAIYGPILYQSNGSTDHINNKFLYIKDMNSGDFYKVPIKNGHYLFFAKPDTEYNVYYHTNNNFKFLKTIDASDLTAGNSYHYRIFSDEL